MNMQKLIVHNKVKFVKNIAKLAKKALTPQIFSGKIKEYIKSY